MANLTTRDTIFSRIDAFDRKHLGKGSDYRPGRPDEGGLGFTEKEHTAGTTPTILGDRIGEL